MQKIWHILGQCLFISSKRTWYIYIYIHILGQYLYYPNMSYTGTVFIYIIQNSMIYTGRVFIFIIQNNMTYTGTVVVCFTQRTGILFFDYIFPNQHPVCPVLYYTAAVIDRSLLNIYSILFLCKKVCSTRLTIVRTGEKIVTPTALRVSVTSETVKVCAFGNSGKEKQSQCVHEIFSYKEWNRVAKCTRFLMKVML